MPLTPNISETFDIFMSRFMNDEDMVKQYEKKERAELGAEQWRIKKGNDVEILESGELADILRRNLDESPDKEPIITEVFITKDRDNFRVSDGESVLKSLVGHVLEKTKHLAQEIEDAKIEVSKSVVEGSVQNDNELSQFNNQSELVAIEPPYPPDLLSKFLEVDETHYRCVATKVNDAVKREYILEPVTNKDGSPYEVSEQKKDNKGEKGAKTVVNEENKSFIKQEVTLLRDFIENANDVIDFQGVLERCALDYEAIGWAAIEVIRGKDMRIKKIAHIPASRVRPLKGWKGFLERGALAKETYFQRFGEKVLALDENGDYVPYSPRTHGPLEAKNSKLKWNLRSREAGDKGAVSFEESANEIIWIPRHHPNTIYFGYSDAIPAAGHILSNVHIRDYLLQFFDHNTIPQYAIIIKGAKLSPDVQEAISRYFSEEVKGKAHKTLIIPIPSTGGEISVTFEKLGSEGQDFHQEVRKNNAQFIMTAHGVSPALIGIAEAASLGSGKGLSQAEIYKDRIVTPLQKRWASEINKMFRLGLGILMVQLKFTPLDIRDLEAEKDMLIGYLEDGCLTVNEVREEAKLGGPVEGGDRAFIISGQGIAFVDSLEEISIQNQQALKAQAVKESSPLPSLQQRGKPPISADSKRVKNGRSKTGV